MVDKENFEKDINVPSKEQIMIDGVDVSGCKYLPYCNDKQSNCAFEPNCYFKQLARKTQECEELEKQLETSEKWRIKAESLNENFELKNTCYRKALDEIEEVIKTPCAEDCVYYELSRCYDCIKTSILDIINKAKEKE